jgi:glycyl-tRNA synthetase
MLYFQDIVATLSSFWAKHDCIIVTPYDVEKGAGTSNPFTLLRSLGPEPFRTAYIEPCRRPTDGRYGTNPNRVQHYFQFQTILKPSPDDIVDLYIDSLQAIGLDLSQHDIRFVHDDWENPTVGAWGLGWEVWLNGMEITQFTYFQAAAGFSLPIITGEITYGIERIAMYLQNVDSIFDIQWNEKLTYGDLFFQDEIQWSTYNFESQDEKMWMRHFEDFQNETKRLVSLNLSIPAYDFVLKSSHAFNMLDAKGVISVSERASYIAKIRDLAKSVAESYLKFREELGFPLVEPKAQQSPTPTESLIPSPKHPKEDFVFEIGTEELPATFVPIGIEQLSKAFKRLLTENNLSYSSLKTVGAPRRLAVIIEGLCTEREEAIIEKRGPSIETAWDGNGELMPAGQGFLRTISASPCTLQEVEQGKIPELSIKEIRSQRYLFATVKTPSIYTSQILHDALPSLIKSLEFPKMMRWGSYTSNFARPIRWILSILGENVIPVQLEQVQADRWSMGHRQLDARKIELSTAREYESALEKAYVLVDQNRRRDRLSSQILNNLSIFQNGHKRSLSPLMPNCLMLLKRS